MAIGPEGRDWRLTMTVPRAAVALPVDGDEDPRPWAAATASALLAAAEDADADTESQLAEDLAAAALDSRSRRPIMAYALYPDPTAGELARLEVREIARGDDAPELTVAVLEDFFAMPLPEGVDEPQVVRGDLPLGPAVRVRRQFAADPDEFGDALVVQTVAYAVRPEHPVAVDFALVLFMSWTAVPHSERLFDLADEVAPTLRLAPQPRQEDEPRQADGVRIGT